jgi:hypothetical protein
MPGAIGDMDGVSATPVGPCQLSGEDFPWLGQTDRVGLGLSRGRIGCGNPDIRSFALYAEVVASTYEADTRGASPANARPTPAPAIADERGRASVSRAIPAPRN